MFEKGEVLLPADSRCANKIFNNKNGNGFLFGNDQKSADSGFRADETIAACPIASESLLLKDLD